jgi:hypothetical protein
MAEDVERDDMDGTWDKVFVVGYDAAIGCIELSFGRIAGKGTERASVSFTFDGIKLEAALVPDVWLAM